MTRDEVLREFSRPYQSHEDVGGPDADAMADEIVRLRGERDALKQRLVETEADWAQCISASDDLEEEAKEYKSKWAELACVISNLREPSRIVMRRMTQRTIEGLHHVDLDIVLDAIRVALPAAVEAAEQEVSGD